MPFGRSPLLPMLFLAFGFSLSPTVWVLAVGTIFVASLIGLGSDTTLSSPGVWTVVFAVIFPTGTLPVMIAVAFPFVTVPVPITVVPSGP